MCEGICDSCVHVVCPSGCVYEVCSHVSDHSGVGVDEIVCILCMEVCALYDNICEGVCGCRGQFAGCACVCLCVHGGVRSCVSMGMDVSPCVCG